MSANLLLRVARALGAAQHTDDPELAVFYLAHARIQLAKAKAEMRELALMLQAREEELLRRGAPKTQLAIGEAKS